MLDKTKVIITGFTKNNIDEILNNVVYIDDNINIIPKFTTNKSDESFYNNYIDVITINLAFKNNALIYISTVDYISTGILTDDFINNDICYIDMKNFNNIPDKIFNTYDILVVWLDSKNTSLSNSEKIESKCFQDRINSLKYIYFLDDNPMDISRIIYDYISGDENRRNEILEENS